MGFESLIRNFDLLRWAAPCPSCGGKRFAILDDDANLTMKTLCRCGATTRIKRDDPKLMAYLDHPP